jgi:hypothetical protein
LRGLLKREIKVSGVVLATAALMLLIATASHTCAAGACDTEDFYPSQYIHRKWSYVVGNQRIDAITTYNLWTSKSQYFRSGFYFSFDFYRTVSCNDGTDKDVYDYLFYRTSLPDPPREDVEEWNPWNPLCYISPRSCNEEVEIGTKSPQNIETNRWYYVDVYFVVKKAEKYAMRIEPEVEPATTITPPPWEEWCELACYDTKAGSSGW